MFQSAMSALEKLSSFLAEEPEVAEPEHPHERAVDSAAESSAAEGASGTVQGCLLYTSREMTLPEVYRSWNDTLSDCA